MSLDSRETAILDLTNTVMIQEMNKFGHQLKASDIFPWLKTGMADWNRSCFGIEAANWCLYSFRRLAGNLSGPTREFKRACSRIILVSIYNVCGLRSHPYFNISDITTDGEVLFQTYLCSSSSIGLEKGSLEKLGKGSIGEKLIIFINVLYPSAYLLMFRLIFMFRSIFLVSRIVLCSSLIQNGGFISVCR